MENRITQLFRKKKGDILSVYFTAGYPELNDTMKIIKYLGEAGVDMIEIGIPFSDPLADGPVIQQSSMKAIQNGMTLKHLFEQLKKLREVTDIPVLLMGYLNPVLQFGESEFAKNMSETGIDGMILPDMPLDYYKEFWEKNCKEYNLSNILLITPETSSERIAMIDSSSTGFIYMVSSNSITGRNNFSTEQEAYFKRVKELGLKTPFITGFGITDNESFLQACKYSRGAIIGSAFIRHISNHGVSKKIIEQFVKGVRGE
jgi:tryptophan synthase alpha chain